jgi:hypothetical protein
VAAEDRIEPSFVAEKGDADDECRVAKGDDRSENVENMQETWRTSFSSSLSRKRKLLCFYMGK